jgi:hypothetical protein
VEPPGLKIMLLLLLLGNLFGFITLQRDKQNMQTKYPRLTNPVLRGIHVIQFANILAIIGTWQLGSWAVWLSLVLAVLVILLDVYIKLWYHIGVVIITSLITGYLIYINWALFN